MNVDINTIRLLGAAQLIVIFGSVITERLFATAVGTGSISNILVSISKNLTRMRLSNLVAMAQSLAIIVLGVYYYMVFHPEYEIISLISLGCFLAAGITFAVSKIGANGLKSLSQEFVQAGEPGDSYFQKMGEFLYHGVDRRGNDIHMLFTSIGLLLMNYLFYITESIPRGMAIWGLAAIFLFAISNVLALFDRDFLPGAVILALPYAPY
jgi:hypothetical protein